MENVDERAHPTKKADGPADPDRPHQGQLSVPVPLPSSEEERNLEARVRQKLYAREPLTEEEKAYWVNMPGEKQVEY